MNGQLDGKSKKILPINNKPILYGYTNYAYSQAILTNSITYKVLKNAGYESWFYSNYIGMLNQALSHFYSIDDWFWNVPIKFIKLKVPGKKDSLDIDFIRFYLEEYLYGRESYRFLSYFIQLSPQVYRFFTFKKVYK